MTTVISRVYMQPPGCVLLISQGKAIFDRGIIFSCRRQTFRANKTPLLPFHWEGGGEGNRSERTYCVGFNTNASRPNRNPVE
jgi:hypothetical protein